MDTELGRDHMQATIRTIEDAAHYEWKFGTDLLEQGLEIARNSKRFPGNVNYEKNRYDVLFWLAKAAAKYGGRCWDCNH